MVVFSITDRLLPTPNGSEWKPSCEQSLCNRVSWWCTRSKGLELIRIIHQLIRSLEHSYQQASYAELCDHLNKSAELLQRNPGQLDGILANLDPAQHSLGYLAVLVARISQVSDFQLKHPPKIKQSTSLSRWLLFCVYILDNIEMFWSGGFSIPIYRS